MLLGHGHKLVHHGGELGQLDDAVLVGVRLGEELQHEPVELHVLRAGGRGEGGPQVQLVLLHAARVEDGVGVHGGDLGGDVLAAEPQPLVEGDHAGGLQIHRVEHPLSGGVLLSL